MNQTERRDISNTHGHILNPHEIDEIRSDIKAMVAPSWLTSVPQNLGSASHGKLKADQWRVLGSTYIPISLVRLWSNVKEGDKRSVECHKIMVATMSLLSAVIVASSRVTSENNADIYFKHMQSYLNDIRKLFPTYQLHPNHHMALHLHEYLLLYGPVHSWWTFPFERLIGILQRIPTSNKIGELEQTIAQSFVKSANLRGLVSKADCPTSLGNCEAMFDKLVNPQVRNTLLTDMLALSGSCSSEKGPIAEDDIGKDDRTTGPIPESVYQSLKAFLKTSPPRRAYFLTHLTVNGITYSVSTRHLGNSSVMIHSDSKVTSVPARIDHILQFYFEDHLQTFIVVRCRQHSLSNHDPFLQHPILRMSIWSMQLKPPEIVTLNDIDCHYAYVPTVWDGDQACIITSLSRVCIVCLHAVFGSHMFLLPGIPINLYKLQVV